MCVYGGSAVPQGGVGDRHLVTIPQGVVGDRLPWGGERQGAGGGTIAYSSVHSLFVIRHGPMVRKRAQNLPCACPVHTLCGVLSKSV